MSGRLFRHTNPYRCYDDEVELPRSPAQHICLASQQPLAICRPHQYSQDVYPSLGGIDLSVEAAVRVRCASIIRRGVCLVLVSASRLVSESSRFRACEASSSMLATEVGVRVATAGSMLLSPPCQQVCIKPSRWSEYLKLLTERSSSVLITTLRRCMACCVAGSRLGVRIDFSRPAASTASSIAVSEAHRRLLKLPRCPMAR